MEEFLPMTKKATLAHLIAEEQLSNEEESFRARAGFFNRPGDIKKTEYENTMAPWKLPVAFSVKEVFTKKECDDLIAASENYPNPQAESGRGYSQALLNIGEGRQKLNTGTRNSGRVYIDDEKLADRIWQRIKHHVPKKVDCHYEPLGLNERLRFLKYETGGYFVQHQDGAYKRPKNHTTQPNAQSRLTFLLYLNGKESFEGGNLVMNGGDKSDPEKGRHYPGGPYNPYEIKPEAGMVVIHHHRIWHEATPITSGVRYCVRTDVMFPPVNKEFEDYIGKQHSGFLSSLTERDRILLRVEQEKMERDQEKKCCTIS